MKGKYTLYIDQWGNKFGATTLKDLRRKIGNGGSRVSKMYIDKTSGQVVQIGYVIGHHWLTAYQPVEIPAN